MSRLLEYVCIIFLIKVSKFLLQLANSELAIISFYIRKLYTFPDYLFYNIITI